METTNLEQRVRQSVATMLGFPLDEVKLESDLSEDLQADSLDLVELVMHIEDEFNLEIEDEKAEQCKTVQDILNIVSELSGDKHETA